jgi:GNAT superfamily N-acetyltransferase
VRLRKARPDEAETLTQLALRSKRSWGYDEAFMQAIQDDMVVLPQYLEDEYSMVAEQDGAAIAYSIMRVEGAGAYLRDLFVDPPFMRGGVGTMLFEDALAFARTAGVKRLEFVADPNAVGFYERYGARVVAQLRSTYVAGRTLPLMAMDLA